MVLNLKLFSSGLTLQSPQSRGLGAYSIFWTRSFTYGAKVLIHRISYLLLVYDHPLWCTKIIDVGGFRLLIQDLVDTFPGFSHIVLVQSNSFREILSL